MKIEISIEEAEELLEMCKDAKKYELMHKLDVALALEYQKKK